MLGRYLVLVDAEEVRHQSPLFGSVESCQAAVGVVHEDQLKAGLQALDLGDRASTASSE